MTRELEAYTRAALRWEPRGWIAANVRQRTYRYSQFCAGNAAANPSWVYTAAYPCKRNLGHDGNRALQRSEDE